MINLNGLTEYEDNYKLSIKIMCLCYYLHSECRKKTSDIPYLGFNVELLRYYDNQILLHDEMVSRLAPEVRLAFEDLSRYPICCHVQSESTR